MEKGYTCDLICSPYLSNNNDYNSWRIMESSVLRTFMKMYSDGILTLKPKDVNVKNSRNKLPIDKSEMERFQVTFYDE